MYKKEYNELMRSRKERWRRIVIDGEETNYSISNLGRFKNRKFGKIINMNDESNKYKLVTIRTSKGRYNIGIHRLIAIYFNKIPKRHLDDSLTFKELIPNHIDGVKSHNASFNLEWLTPKENTSHAWRTGLCEVLQGENNHLAKITENDAITICELIMEKKNNAEIEEITGISKNTIQHIRSGECWKHISSNYDFPKLAKDLRFTIPLETIHAICKDLEKKEYSDSELARRYGLQREYIRDMRLHKLRTSITKDYNF